jgi:protein disulfide-isomerase A1
MNKNILIFFLIAFIVCKGPYQIENDVLALNEQTFGIAIREFKYLLVLFYDPSCPHCQNFMPVFEKIASNLKKESFILAKLDCVKNEKIANHFDIEAFPTVTLLKNNEKVVYEGERKEEDIEKWLREKTKPEFKKISTETDFEDFKKNNKVFLSYFGNDEKVINKLIVVERQVDEIPMVIIDSDPLIKKYVDSGKKESIAIFKHFDDKKNILQDEITTENLIKFINIYMYPKVMEFSKENSHLIFTKRNPSLILFTNKNDRIYIENFHLLKNLWDKAKDKVKLFICDIRDTMSASLANYCSISIYNIPKVFIVYAENQIPTKYKMSGTINEDNVMKFINEWSNGRLTPFIRSEEIPKNNNGDVFTLVGKNFKKEVLENDKDVLVYFLAPSCRVCKEFLPKLENLAKKLKERNPKLLIAKMDPTMNDVEGYEIQKFPTIKFYPGNAKDKEPLEFFTRKNIDSLFSFIKNNTYHKIIEDKETDL